MKPAQIFLLVIVVVVFGVVVSRFLPERKMVGPKDDPAVVAEGPLNPNLPQQAAAVLQMRTGTVVLVRNGERYSAHAELELKPGDRLEIGESDAFIIWPHYGRTTLQAGSVVSIQKAFESTNRERFEGRLSLERGRMWTKFYDTLFQGQVFQIRVGSVLLDISGGSFGVAREENDDVTIDVRSQAIRALTVKDEVPTGDMRKAGFSEMYAEIAQSEIREIGGRAVKMSQDGSVTDVGASTDVFAELGDMDLSRETLDVQPSSATLLPESSL